MSTGLQLHLDSQEDRAMDSRAYDALHAEAQRIGWPKLWRDDLIVHDRARLFGKDRDGDFIWALRECGTHIVAAWDDDDHAAEWVGAIDRAFKRDDPDEDTRWYLWRNNRLSHIGFKRAYEIAREWDHGHLARKSRSSGIRVHG